MRFCPSSKTSTKSSMKAKGARALAITATIGNLLQGWDGAAIAGALLYIKPEYQLEDKPTLEGFVVASTLIGAVVSTALAGPAADWLGRRKTLCISAFLFCSSACTMAFAPGMYSLIGARVVVGCSIGLAATISPILVAESAPAEIRGELATYPQLMGACGQSLAYVITFVVSLSGNPDWRFMLGILFLPSVTFLLVCVFYLPESPRWLVSKGRMLEAREVLQNLRGREDVAAELALLVEGLGVGSELEEWLIQPADASTTCDSVKPSEEISFYGNEGGVCWKAMPRSVAGSHPQLLGQCGSASGSSISFRDPLVGSFQVVQDLFRAEPVTSDEGWEADVADEQDAEEFVAGDMDESLLETPLLVSDTNSDMGIGGGWQLAWRHSMRDSSEAESLQRAYILQESCPVEQEPVQAAVLVAPFTQPSINVMAEVAVGPAMVHPAGTASPGPAWNELFLPGVQRALGVGVVLQAFQQMCGINAVMIFTPQILEQSGADVLASLGLGPASASILASGISSLLMLPCIVVAMWLMDRSGRRQLLLATLPLLSAALVAVAATDTFLSPGLLKAAASFGGVTLFICAFVMGFGPIPNIICSEIFPTRVRGICIGICSATMWATNILVTYSFPFLKSSIGLSGVFCIFCVVSIVSWYFIFHKVPETKGMPLEIISELFALTAHLGSDEKEDS